MKKIIILAASLMLSGVKLAFCDIGDDLKTALLSQVQPITQFSSDGTSRVALLDDILQIGKYNGEYLGFAQVGPSTTVDSGDNRIEGYLLGGSFNWSPILRKLVSLPSGWKFLNEQFVISSGYHYDTAEHKPQFSYVQFSIVVPIGSNQ